MLPLVRPVGAKLSVSHVYSRANGMSSGLLERARSVFEQKSAKKTGMSLTAVRTQPYKHVPFDVRDSCVSWESSRSVPRRRSAMTRAVVSKDGF